MSRLLGLLPALLTLAGLALVVAAVAALVGGWWAAGLAGVVLVVIGERADW